MNRIALHCSSFVGKQTGYAQGTDWDSAVQAVEAYYRPIETYAERFEQLLLEIKAVGYDALDVWQPGQLDWRWATDEHIRIAREMLTRHNLTVTSYAGEYGATREEFNRACQIAMGIHAPLLSGTTTLLADDRSFVVKLLKEFDLKLGVENHPEKSAREILEQLGDGGDGRIGTAVDIGWYATRGADAVRAIEELGDHILHVHLKDVLPGDEQINVGFGQGCVPLEASVRALKKIGYTGDYSVEDEGLNHDPTEELKAALALVRQWLALPAP
jgi:sugar phosphate isomerase/epimerase